jgi:hypothetical protein
MSVLLGFVWSAEAMWEIATEKLHLAGDLRCRRVRRVR